MLSDSMRLPLPSVEMVACMSAKSPVQNAKPESYSPKYEVPGESPAVVSLRCLLIRLTMLPGSVRQLRRESRKRESTKTRNRTGPRAPSRQRQIEIEADPLLFFDSC